MTLLNASKPTDSKEFIAAFVRLCEIAGVNPYEMKSIRLEDEPVPHHFTMTFRHLDGPSFIDPSTRLPSRQIVTRKAYIPAQDFANYLTGKTQFAVPGRRVTKPPGR